MADMGTSSAKTIAKGAGFFMIGIFASKLITYFYRLFIARYFGAEDFGIFSLGLAVAGIFLMAASLGLPNAVLRNVAYYESKNQPEKLRGTLIFSYLGIGIFSLIIVAILLIASGPIAIGIFHNEELIPVIRIMAISIPFMGLLTINAQAFGGFRNAKFKIFTEKIVLNVLSLILVIAFGLLGYGVMGIAISYTLAVFFTFIISLYLLESKVYPFITSKLKIQVSDLQVRETLSFSLPLVFAGFASTIIQWTDTLMIGFFINATEVGIYNVVLATGFLLTAIAPALGTLLLPVMSDIYARKNKGELKGISKTVTKWIFYFNFPVFLIIMVFPTKLLALLFGTEYAPGHTALIILAVGFMISSLILVESNILILLKKTKITMGITSIAGLINIILNYILIPLYGINGAALASASSFVASGILFQFYSKHYSGIISISSNLLKSAASGLLALLLVLVPINIVSSNLHPIILFIAVAMFGVIYTVFLLVLRGFDSTDLEIMRSIENRTGIRIHAIRKLVRRFSG